MNPNIDYFNIKDFNFKINNGISGEFLCKFQNGIIQTSGKLFITSSKLIFFSIFNQSALFCNTIITIPILEIVSYSICDSFINIVFNRSEYKFEFHLKSFDSFVSLLTKIKKEIEESKINSSILNRTSVECSREETQTSVFETTFLKEIDFEAILEKSNFFKKIRTLTEMRFIKIQENLKKNFVITVVENKSLGNIPLFLVYDTIYNNKNILNELGKNKNFFETTNELGNDTNVQFEDLSKDQEIPLFFENQEYASHLMNIDQHTIENLLNELENWPIMKTYSYKYTHPCKKTFLGPNYINVSDLIKIYFISPTCLIVDVVTSFSGFFMLDTFFNFVQYRYDSDIKFDNVNKKLEFETRVTVRFGQEFVKLNLFKSKIESSAISETNETVKEFILPLIEKILKIRNEKFQYQIKDFERNTSVNNKLNI